MNTSSNQPGTSAKTIHWPWNRFIMRLKIFLGKRMSSTLSIVEEESSIFAQYYSNVGDQEHPLFIGSTYHPPMNFTTSAKRKKLTILKNYMILRSQNSMGSTGTTNFYSKHMLMKDIQLVRLQEQQEYLEQASHLQLTESENT